MRMVYAYKINLTAGDFLEACQEDSEWDNSDNT